MLIKINIADNTTVKTVWVESADLPVGPDQRGLQVLSTYKKDVKISFIEPEIAPFIHHVTLKGAWAKNPGCLAFDKMTLE